jgi:hypothetical protein
VRGAASENTDLDPRAFPEGECVQVRQIALACAKSRERHIAPTPREALEVTTKPSFAGIFGVSKMFAEYDNSERPPEPRRNLA